MNHDMQYFRNTIFTAILVTVALLFSQSCNNKKETSTPITPSETKDTPVANKYALIPFNKSVEYPEAKLELNSYQNGQFDFNVSGGNYELGAQTPDADQKMCANSGKGQHIHLIRDKDPYIAQYVPSFGVEYPNGNFHILAFLSRSYHESIKTDDAHIAKLVKIENNSIVSERDIETEMIFYSRPKGTYVGKKDTEKVMLDFYLVNVDMEFNRAIKVTINGEEHTVQTWQPYYIQGLPMGKNTVTIDLVDDRGKSINVPGNPITREFELKEDPADAM